MLTGDSLAIVQRLCHQYPDGVIIQCLLVRGVQKGQYVGHTTSSLCKRFWKLSIQSTIKVVACTLRHSYATNAIVETDTEFAEVAALMGHKDSTMVEKIYGHHRDCADYMRRIAEKAKRGLSSDDTGRNQDGHREVG